MTVWSGESFCTPAKAKRFLRSIGYTGTSREVGYDSSLIRSKVNEGCPVFIGAMTDNCFGHAWVIDGQLYQEKLRRFYNANGVFLKAEPYVAQQLYHCN